jgi:hypothetical protein
MEILVEGSEEGKLISKMILKETWYHTGMTIASAAMKKIFRL